MTAKRLLYTMAAGMALGALVGVLYAPEKGAETRRKINKLKRKLSCCPDDATDEERETLEELSNTLQEELERINKRLSSI